MRTFFSLIPLPKNEKIETKIECFCHNKCPGAHSLSEYIFEVDEPETEYLLDQLCVTCEKYFNANEVAYGCWECEHYICADCYKTSNNFLRSFTDSSREDFAEELINLIE